MKKHKTTDQKLWKFYHLQFDKVETWQSRPSEITDYCECKADAAIVLMNMNFRSIETASLLGQTMH